MTGSADRRARTWTAAALVALAAAGWQAPGLLASDGAQAQRRTVVCVPQDERISESSGLVVRARLLWTVNDSGDGPVLYALDRDTCRTVREARYATEDPVDVEALAPGHDGAIWVGDIGDNGRSRGSVVVHRVRPRPPSGGGTLARSFELAYPDGPQDAETLMVHPVSGRLHLVTKGPFTAGAVYRAPTRLRVGEVHLLERIGAAPALVTDGAFTADGRHVVLRDYGSATVLRFPTLERVGSFALPHQEQGEALAVVGDRLWLSSEGVATPVLSVAVPRRLGLSRRTEVGRSPVPQEPMPEAAGGPAADSAGPDTGPDTGADTGPDTGAGWGRRAGLVAALVSATLVVLGSLLRASRRRSRRSW